MKPRTVTKLRVAQRRADNKIVAVVWNDRAERNLATVHDSYRAILGRPVSRSMMIRRATELLSQHVATITKPEVERAALALHL